MMIASLNGALDSGTMLQSIPEKLHEHASLTTKSQSSHSTALANVPTAGRYKPFSRNHCTA